MMAHRARIAGLWMLAGAALLPAGARGQAATRPAGRGTPEVEIDLTTPARGLQSYFRARRATDEAAILKTLETTEARKKPYVALAVNYLMWRHYLERQAVQKFGTEAGVKVEGHARTLDDQLLLDMRRVSESTTELSKGETRERAHVFLKIEADRPDGLQSDRFDYLDSYWMIKTADGWKVDFLKSFDCEGDDKEVLLKFEAGIFPIMANALRDLSTKLEKGEFASAEQLKAALQQQWNKAYGDTPEAK